jgi:hypothetical protein
MTLSTRAISFTCKISVYDENLASASCRLGRKSCRNVHGLNWISPGGIRTPTSRSRVCRATITQPGNNDRRRIKYNPRPPLVNTFLRVLLWTSPLMDASSCGRVFLQTRPPSNWPQSVIRAHSLNSVLKLTRTWKSCADFPLTSLGKGFRL